MIEHQGQGIGFTVRPVEITQEDIEHGVNVAPVGKYVRFWSSMGSTSIFVGPLEDVNPTMHDLISALWRCAEDFQEKSASK